MGFLGTGITVAVLRHDGTAARISEVLKMSVRTPVSWSAHSLSTHLGMFLGPAAFRVFTLLRVLLTSAVPRLSGCSSERGTFPRRSGVECLQTPKVVI